MRPLLANKPPVALYCKKTRKNKELLFEKNESVFCVLAYLLKDRLNIIIIMILTPSDLSRP